MAALDNRVIVVTGAAKRIGRVIALRLASHINHDGLDNRRCNLRLCSRENTCNKQLMPTNKSGFKGVSWYKALGKWHACIEAQGKTKHLGYYKDARDAGEAYDRAALSLLGNLRRRISRKTSISKHTGECKKQF